MTRRETLARRSAAIVWLLLALVFAGCSLNMAPSDSVSVEISGPPVVQIVSPLPNAAYLEDVVVNIQALVRNAGADIDRVEVTIDGEVIATLESPNEAGTVAFSVTHSWPAAGVGTHEAGVTAYRGDGTASAPASVAFTVVDRSALGAPEATETVEPRETVPPTRPPATPTRTQPQTQATVPPTAAVTDSPAVTPTPNRPIANFTQGINVRSGPGTVFNPPIGSFAAGQSAEILALNPAGDWLKVRYFNGEGWVFAGLVQITGDVSTLPRDPGPPPPTAAPPTAVPPTAAPPPTSPPASQANLVAGIVVLNPAQPVCNQTIEIGFDVANLGSEPTSSSGTISVTDVRVADGSVQGSTIGAFPVLQPGQTFRAVMFLTISTWYEEDHRITFVIDPDNQVPETGDGDNTTSVTYRLQRGSCP